MKLPGISLFSTDIRKINVSELSGYIVIYCYPRTGIPNTSLPKGWDEIPGARGCTPQSCSYRDHYEELKSLNVEVYGLSTQTSEYQQEMVKRLHLPFPVLSDSEFKFTLDLHLPTFEINDMKLLKRLTMIIKNGVIEAIHYPVFPSDSDPIWVINYLMNRNAS